VLFLINAKLLHTLLNFWHWRLLMIGSLLCSLPLHYILSYIASSVKMKKYRRHKVCVAKFIVKAVIAFCFKKPVRNDHQIFHHMYRTELKISLCNILMLVDKSDVWTWFNSIPKFNKCFFVRWNDALFCKNLSLKTNELLFQELTVNQIVSLDLRNQDAN